MYKHSIYVPSQSSTYNVTAEQRANVLNYVQYAMSKTFGGCTSLDSVGHWVNDDGVRVRESVTIVYSYSDDEGLAMQGLADYVKAVLRQDCVLITRELVDSIKFV